LLSLESHGGMSIQTIETGTLPLGHAKRIIPLYIILGSEKHAISSYVLSFLVNSAWSGRDKHQLQCVQSQRYSLNQLDGKQEEVKSPPPVFAGNFFVMIRLRKKDLSSISCY